jgi:endonuclease/exonuclease/phosphatase family metal-dependent hydrolase
MRLLSWNIQWGLGCDGKLDLTRIADVIWAMGEADVICLQEVAVNHATLPGSSGEDQVDVLRSLFPGYSAHYGVGSDLAGEHGQRRLFGNLMLSRLPVLQVFRHSLPCYAYNAIACMPRIALEAIVSCSTHSVRVITTHLEYYCCRAKNGSCSETESHS